MISLMVGSKKRSLVSRNRPGENVFVTYPSAKPNVYHNIYFLFQTIKRHPHTNKQTNKSKRNKIENRKTIETKGEKKKKNVVFGNNICGKSNDIRWYRLRIGSAYF